MQVAPLIPGQFEWPGEVVKLVGYTRDVTSIDRNREPDTEGYVVLGGDYKTRVKLKTDEYMRLHKILTGVSSVTIWDMLRNGDSIDVLYDKVPDEFADWAKATVASLEEAFYEVLSAVADEYMGLAPLLPDRKAFAAEAVKSPYRAILFRTADDKDIVPLIWKMIKPERTLPYLALDESVV
jgi:RNA ligase